MVTLPQSPLFLQSVPPPHLCRFDRRCFHRRRRRPTHSGHCQGPPSSGFCVSLAGGPLPPQAPTARGAADSQAPSPRRVSWRSWVSARRAKLRTAVSRELRFDLGAAMPAAGMAVPGPSDGGAAAGGAIGNGPLRPRGMAHQSAAGCCSLPGDGGPRGGGRKGGKGGGGGGGAPKEAAEAGAFPGAEGGASRPGVSSRIADWASMLRGAALLYCREVLEAIQRAD